MLLTEAEIHRTLTNIDQVPVVHDVVQDGATRGTGIVAASPYRTQLECLVLPGEEADPLHDGRLDDLLAREHAPGDGIGTFGLRVRVEVARFGHGVVGEIRVVLNALLDLWE